MNIFSNFRSNISLFQESMQQTDLFCKQFFLSCLTKCLDLTYAKSKCCAHDMERVFLMLPWGKMLKILFLRAADNVNCIKLKLISMSSLIVPA